MFATVFVGQYHPEKRELIYANAGHSPVIFCPNGGSARMFEADGPAMGVLSLSLSEDYSISFNPGDVLIVATDGFSEARSVTGEMYGYTRLLKLVEQVAHLSANEIADAFFDVITDFGSNCPQDDDQTLIVIKGIEA
jgi:sigma-B regulation protein RsbU (phosphoserine phosphatase)